jgi:hypothetical protein
MPLASISVGEDASLDNRWYSMPALDVTAGERVGSSRVWKLVVVGNPPPAPALAAADLNLYQVALSTSSTENISPQGARIWAYSWTYLIPAGQARTPPPLYPYVGANTDALVQYNWDYDRGDQNAGLQIATPARTLALGPEPVSGDNDLQSSGHPAQETERGATWAVRIWADPGQPADNLVTFWATDPQGTALSLFARPTILPPP